VIIERPYMHLELVGNKDYVYMSTADGGYDVVEFSLEAADVNKILSFLSEWKEEYDKQT